MADEEVGIKGRVNWADVGGGTKNGTRFVEVENFISEKAELTSRTPS